MLPTPQGSLRLFRLFGVTVFLHWSWFLVALIEFSNRNNAYSSLGWNALEYLTLFAIVVVHEFGHALACRQVGGKADTIMLWPLGGIALVAPPQRPGAMLWSVAAGPLVNVVLVVPLSFLYFAAVTGALDQSSANLFIFIRSVWWMNLGLLIFNLFPVYPLDGGQILRSLLWFMVGPARSLAIATVIGFFGGTALILLAIFLKSMWFGVMAVFMLFSCWRAFSHARLLLRFSRLPRHEKFSCPQCQKHPIKGPFWVCHKCAHRFDTFESHAICPSCHTQFPTTRCTDCGTSSPLAAWGAAPASPLPVAAIPEDTRS